MMTKRLPREYGEPKELYAIDKEKLEERIKRIGGNMTDFGQTTAYVLNVLKNCLVPLSEPTPEEQPCECHCHCSGPGKFCRHSIPGEQRLECRHCKPTPAELCKKCGKPVYNSDRGNLHMCEADDKPSDFWTQPDGDIKRELKALLEGLRMEEGTHPEGSAAVARHNAKLDDVLKRLDLV